VNNIRLALTQKMAAEHRTCTFGVCEQPYMDVWAAPFPPANAFAQVPIVRVPV